MNNRFIFTFYSNRFGSVNTLNVRADYRKYLEEDALVAILNYTYCKWEIQFV